MRGFAILHTRFDDEKCVTEHRVIGVYANKDEALKQYNHLVEQYTKEDKIYWENFNKTIKEEYRLPYEEKVWSERMMFIDRIGDGIELSLLKTEINF